MLKRTSLSLVDQAINSLSSLVLAIMVARESTAIEVGAWAIGYAIYTFVLTISRASISTTAIITNNDLAHGADRQAELEGDRETVSAATFASLGLAVVVVPFGLLLEGALAFYIVLFGVSLPILIWQDALRYATIRQGRLGRTVVIDTVWIVLQVVFGLTLLTYVNDGKAVTVGWVAASIVSLIVASFLVSPKISPSRAAQFFGQHKKTIGGLLVESSLGAGVANLQPAILGMVIGLAATGYFRGALSLLGVASALVMGLTPIATLEAVRRLRVGQSAAPVMWIWIAGIGTVGASLTVLAGLIPESLGTALLGETWVGAEVIFPILAAQVIFRGPNAGVPIVLRAAHKLRVVVTLRVISSLTTLVITTLSAAAFGLLGAAWGWLAASAIISIVSFYAYLEYGRSDSIGS